jgi:hypothetical protein
MSKQLVNIILSPAAVFVAVSLVGYIGLKVVNDYLVSSFYPFPEEFVASGIIIGLAISLVLHHRSISRLTRKAIFWSLLVVGLAYGCLGLKTLVQLQGVSLGSGDVNGVNYTVVYRYSFGFRERDSDEITIYRTSELRKFAGLGAPGTPPSGRTISPGSGVCEQELCEGLHSATPRKASFGPKGVTLHFSDNRSMTYAAIP